MPKGLDSEVKICSHPPASHTGLLITQIPLSHFGVVGQTPFKVCAAKVGFFFQFTKKNSKKIIFLCKNSPFCNPGIAIYNKIVRLRALFYYILIYAPKILDVSFAPQMMHPFVYVHTHVYVAQNTPYLHFKTP